MHFKTQFRNRLERLYSVLGVVLYRDNHGQADHPSDLMPSLFSVFSYIWSFKAENIFKK